MALIGGLGPQARWSSAHSAGRSSLSRVHVLLRVSGGCESTKEDLRCIGRVPVCSPRGRHSIATPGEMSIFSLPMQRMQESHQISRSLSRLHVLWLQTLIVSIPCIIIDGGGGEQAMFIRKPTHPLHPARQWSKHARKTQSGSDGWATTPTTYNQRRCI